MYKYKHFIRKNIAPSGAVKIGVYNGNGDKIADIPLGHLTPPQAAKRYSFCALSDVHITYDTANTDFQRALTYVENSDCSFTCISGDLTSTGADESQLSLYKDIVDTYSPNKPVYAIAGNHENYNGFSDKYLEQYTGHPLYYSFANGNDVFIMLGHYGAYVDGQGWVAGEQFSDVELQWCYETLEANRNKRCFVFIHVFPWGGSGNANGLYATNNWTSTKGTVFETLMKHYKNTVLFHGHSHLRFDLQESDELANYTDKDGYRSIHVPSLSVPRDLVDGSLAYVYAESEGYIVDVHDNYIILNGRDFIDNDADGHIIPIATYKIDTRLVDIPANTFTDSTGTIAINQQ